MAFSKEQHLMNYLHLLKGYSEKKLIKGITPTQCVQLRFPTGRPVVALRRPNSWCISRSKGCVRVLRQSHHLEHLGLLWKLCAFSDILTKVQYRATQTGSFQNHAHLTGKLTFGCKTTLTLDPQLSRARNNHG